MLNFIMSLDWEAVYAGCWCLIVWIILDKFGEPIMRYLERMMNVMVDRVIYRKYYNNKREYQFEHHNNSIDKSVKK